MCLADTTIAATHGYPRLMAMEIGGPDRYDDPVYQRQMARFDVVVLNFWPGWKEWKYGPRGVDDVLREIKERNPAILIGQYTNLNEAKLASNPDSANRDVAVELDREHWWLRDAHGHMVQWTDKYQTYDINITDWTSPDRNGQRYPEWYADRNFRIYFEKHPMLDFWYLDNSLSVPPAKSADWNRDGRPDHRRDPAIARAYRLGHVHYWERIRRLQPTALLVGNVDDISSVEYSDRLNGAFLEALIGRFWSIELRRGWIPMMQHYHATLERVLEPKIVGFGVIGPANDYRRLRYGLASCLLDDGFFAYNDGDRQPTYSRATWFDEFDVALGNPIDPPAKAPWQKGVYRRRYEHGMAVVNPGIFPVEIDVEPGYRRFKGSQDPRVNNGQPVGKLVLPAKDGLILVKGK